MEPKILSKYDEEIQGEKKSSFVLGKSVVLGDGCGRCQ